MRKSGPTAAERLTKGRVSQLFDPTKTFGEAAGRNLAHRFGLPPDYFESDKPPKLLDWSSSGHTARSIEDAYAEGVGWLDEGGHAVLAPQEVELIAIFRQLGAQARKVALDEIRATRDAGERVAEELQQRMQRAQPKTKKRHSST